MTAETTESGTDRRRWVGLGVLATGLSMIVLDGTIVGVALPVIIRELRLDLGDAQWVNSLYSVVFAGLLLACGRLGDRLGRRLVFVVGVVVFVVGSLFAAAAQDDGSLIAARAIQGIGGACVLPGTLSTVNATFRGRDRAVAFGVWGAVISGMAAVGPLLGGWLTTAFSWPWIFSINVPIGVAVLCGAYLAVPETRTRIREPGLDVDGLLLSAFGFGALVFALIEGPTLGWWSAKTDLTVLGLTWPESAPISLVPVLLAVGVILVVLFGFWERHRARVRRSSILDLGLFVIPTFSWGNLTALTVAIAEFGLLFVLPLFLVNALGLSTLGAGLVLAAMAAGAFVSGAAARHLAARITAPGVVVVGLSLELVGVLAVALVLGNTVSPWWVAVLLVIYGAGLGLASAQLTGTTLVDIPPEKSGQGSATQSTLRQLGAALGTATSGAVLSAALAHTLTGPLAGVTGLPPAAAGRLEGATRASAGSAIGALRQSGGELGPLTPATVDALSAGFSLAARIAMLVVAGFLLLGLLAAIRIVFTSRDGSGS